MRACTAFLPALATAVVSICLPASTASDRLPRGPYLLRQIFGETPQSRPAVWGLSPGLRRSGLPAEMKVDQEVRDLNGRTSLLRQVAGRATVIFVFEGTDPEASLDHVTITLVESTGLTPKAVALHLGKVYGEPDPTPSDNPDGLMGSWQHGAVLLRHFPAAHFFEVTLSSPRPSS